MTLEQIIQTFIEKPAYLEMGAGKLGKRWKVTRDKIYEAKVKARETLQNVKYSELQNIIAEQEEQLGKYIGSQPVEGGEIKKFETTKPLTPSEIEKLAGVDGITSYVARVWDKMLPSGIWTYSIDIRYRVDNFYNKEELDNKLKELFPDLTPVTLPQATAEKGACITIVLSDDHAGVKNLTNLYDAEEYTAEVYKKRLLEIVASVKRWGKGYEELHVISLGDQLNGWNSQTTRGGHEVKSAPNKEQFDFYVQGRTAFYNDLFTSGLATEYFIHEMDNSNHSGLGFSYIANKALEMYLSGKFPQVKYKSYTDILDSFKYGKHIIIFGHGKDEKFQKRPLPYKLDPRTDLFLFNYASSKGYSPNENFITFYKGDLHTYGIESAKFGRYINAPSIVGATDYSDINFGKTRPGALVEIYTKDKNRIATVPIWF